MRNSATTGETDGKKKTDDHLDHDQIVDDIYRALALIHNEPTHKDSLLQQLVPYFDQIARAEAEAYRRANDERLTRFEEALPGTTRSS